MVAHALNIPFEIKIVRKLLLVLDEDGIPIITEFLVIDEVEMCNSLCLLGEGIAIL